jgi:hypothetical protein
MNNQQTIRMVADYTRSKDSRPTPRSHQQSLSRPVGEPEMRTRLGAETMMRGNRE